MAKTTKDIFKEFYPKLLKILPVDSVINQLYSKKLLSSDHKCKLQDMPTTGERAKYFLDKVIERGLEVDYKSQFDEMLAVMANSDDPPVKFMANKMMKSRGVAPPTPMLHNQSQSPQARSQNTETQSKHCMCVYLAVATEGSVTKQNHRRNLKFKFKFP